ncbi:protein DOG1-like 3 [Nicotiana sylvestris]|uniref:Uncharacterized protein LOC104239538 n=1 Tax=Nicotiana sylvestris TaxID=4096 RepID=A0A1U7Y134_NICSY|nr:PREDICTED: uncharacterized protein LOC104239538 [Nicotiana sylvestris]
MSSSINSDQKEEESLHESWLNLQHEELIELEQAAAQIKNGVKDDHKLTQLIAKIINNFQDYCNNRSRLAKKDVSPFFAPKSCTPFENSVLWIGGCRPSSFIRLIYALSGMEIESHLIEFLEGIKTGEFHGLTIEQMTVIDKLQTKTIQEERKLCSKLASLQEDIVDQPLASKMMKDQENADEDLDKHSHNMATVMEEADKLRMKTLKQIVSILITPAQAVEYLAAAKRIRLCLKQWGKKRDHEHTN